MRREQLEHLLRAASRIVGHPDFLVVGSAAILGSFDEARLPMAATRSDEADLAPFDDPDGSKSLAVEGSLGQGSLFHDTFAYYADGVDFRHCRYLRICQHPRDRRPDRWRIDAT